MARTHQALSYNDIRDAVDCIAGAVRPVTLAPVDPGAIPSSGVGQCQVWLALEFMQFSGSVKLRGAQNLVSTHREDATLPTAGLTIACAGNAGLACAWAAKTTATRAAVFVPATTPTRRIDELQALDADVRRAGVLQSEAEAACRDYAASSGALLVDASQDRLFAAGLGTLMVEIHQQIPDLDTVMVAVGSGGLLTGIATAASHFGVRTVAVEHEDHCGLHVALELGPVVEIGIDLIAADTLEARRVSAMALDAAQRFDVRSILVSDNDIAAARKALWEHRRLMVEPAGATALAGLLTGAYTPEPGENVCVVLSGANIDQWSPPFRQPDYPR
ncbi:pyridoxal-phosphate dependent enzyme [Nocardia sp. CA-128927]|uniref:pyridoxal-phosphate dependent enzyme n=1 Tax=Nocardia sp. CA-128927 TaxID=3239975 RepID=UPI003D985C09